MNRNLYYISTFLIIIGFAFFQMDYLNSNCVQQQHELSNLEFKGVLVKKFLDSTNHNRPVFIIKDYSGESEIKLYSNTKLTKLFNLSAVNDSIIKVSGIDTIILMSKQSSLKFEVDLGCE
jgi:hypothetical protein